MGLGVVDEVASGVGHLLPYLPDRGHQLPDGGASHGHEQDPEEQELTSVPKEKTVAPAGGHPLERVAEPTGGMKRWPGVDARPLGASPGGADAVATAAGAGPAAARPDLPGGAMGRRRGPGEHRGGPARGRDGLNDVERDTTNRTCEALGGQTAPLEHTPRSP